MRKCTFLGINGWNYSCSQGQFHVSRHIVCIGPKVGEFPSGVLGGNQEEMEGEGGFLYFSLSWWHFWCLGTSPDLPWAGLYPFWPFQNRGIPGEILDQNEVQICDQGGHFGPKPGNVGDNVAIWSRHILIYAFLLYNKISMSFLLSNNFVLAPSMFLLPGKNFVIASTKFLHQGKNFFLAS